MRTAPSEPPVSTQLPSGENSSHSNDPLSNGIVASSAPVDASQILILIGLNGFSATNPTSLVPERSKRTPAGTTHKSSPVLVFHTLAPPAHATKRDPSALTSSCST